MVVSEKSTSFYESKHPANSSANSWQKIGRSFRFRFRMIQITANLIGVVICVTYFVYFDDIRPVVVNTTQYLLTAALSTFLLLVLGAIVNFLLLKPILRYVAVRAAGHTPSSGATRKVQRRLLNMPLMAGSVGMFNWSLAAFFIPLVLHWLPSSSPPEEWLLNFLWMFTAIILSGVVTSVLVFFGQEISIRRLHADFFPQGGVTDVPGVFRINLRSRVLLFFFLGGLFPMMDMAFLVYNKARMVLSHDPHFVLQELQNLLIYTLVVVGMVTLILAHFLTRSIIEPVQRLQKAMNKVAEGDLATRALVNDNHELGQLGDHFNRMTVGLQERYELRRSIDLAREVQQTLLPPHAPIVSGLDISGKSIYCDATGGDYWDYLIPKQESNGSIDIVVGDVSGHGLPAALLMTSVRAGLRQRVALGGDLATIISDVNRQFSGDAERSGNFMTLFYLSVDRSGQSLEWVRAGHDPALRYDPATDTFEELKGSGIALGVQDDTKYTAHRRNDLLNGQVLAITTDGIWEAGNKDGEMFGKDRLKHIIRENAGADAGTILNMVYEELDRFTLGCRAEDDMTLVIIKV